MQNDLIIMIIIKNLKFATDTYFEVIFLSLFIFFIHAKNLKRTEKLMTDRKSQLVKAYKKSCF